MSTEVRFAGGGGDGVRARYFAPATDDGAPGIVLVHEVFGLDVATREIGARLAGEGFHVLAPDLYSRAGVPGPASSESDPAPAWDVDAIRAAAASVPDRRALADLDAAAAWLGARDEVDERAIAVLGFCLGGTLAFLSGCTSRRFACVVDFYGRVLYAELSANKPMQPVEMLLNLDVPLLALFGEADASIPPADVELLRTSLVDANKDFELVTYPGAGHGFFDHRRERYHADAAADAWRRTLEFLRERL